jgi:multimeric flavodoxin WrbA
MKLTIYNGSPRGKKSNSEVIINHFLRGFDDGENWFSINYLNQKNKTREFVGKFQNADNIIIVFPLYTDAMPGIVKEFFESLQDVQFYTQNQRIGFFIHCGFPESIHLDAIEKYLEKLAYRLGIKYLGTIKRGGSEGFRIAPENFNKNLFNDIAKMGTYFSNNREFSHQLMKRINKNKKFPPFIIPILKLINKTGLFDIYWNKSLKKNNAFEKRYQQPFK